MKRALEPAFCAVLAAIAYLLLAADSFYKVDGIDIVRLLTDGEPHPWHVGYLPALRGFRWLIESVGLSPDLLQLGAWFSAVGAALGVGFARAGMARLGMAPAVAVFATALFAFNPTVLTFATVVEFHGPMLAPYGLVFWWTTLQIQRPSWAGMVLLGALCHLPFLIHSQQLFLPVWLLLFFVLRRGIDRTTLAMAVVAGAVHGALALGLPQLFAAFYGHWADLAEGLRKESSIGRPQSLDYTPAILWHEWIWPWLPLSLFVFVTPFRQSLRREFFAFVLGFVPFLYLSVRQLVDEPEFGAYMLPMVLPAAMLIARRLGGRPFVWLTLGFGLFQFDSGPREHLREQRAEDRVFAERIAAAAGRQEPYVLVGSHRELGSAYARLRPGEFLWVRSTAVMDRAKVTPTHFAAVTGFLLLKYGEGLAVLMTDSALGSLEDPRAAMLAEKPTLEVKPNDAMAGPLFAEFLRQKFEIAPSAPRVFRLVPKQ